MNIENKIRQGSIADRLKFLAKDSVVYGIGSALTRVFALITMPVLTRIFATAEYGALDSMIALSSVFLIFTMLGQDSAVARFYYETEDSAERKEIIAEALVLILGLSVIVCATLCIIAPWILNLTLGSPNLSNTFLILVASFPFQLLNQFYRNLLKWTFARWRFIIMSIGSSAAIVALILFFVLVLHLGVPGVMLAHLIGNILFAALGTIYCRSFLSYPKGYRFVGRMLKFGLPYMAVGVVSMLVPVLDRSIIAHYLSLSDVGFYSAGYKVASLLMLPIMAFQTAWGPFSLSIYKESSAEQTYAKALDYYSIFIGFCTFAVVLLASPFIHLLASARYSAGAAVVMPIAVGLAIESVTWITGMGIDLSKKSYFSSISYLIGLVVSAVSMWALVHFFGIVGVAWGFFLGKLVQGVSYTWFGHHSYPIRFVWRIPSSIIVFILILGALLQGCMR